MDFSRKDLLGKMESTASRSALSLLAIRSFTISKSRTKQELFGIIPTSVRAGKLNRFPQAKLTALFLS